MVNVGVVEDKTNMTTRHNIFAWALTVVLILVVSLIWSDWRKANDIISLDQFRFQKSIGGVGLGAVMVPAWNFKDYDPRLQPLAEDQLYPIPGGYSYSPDRLTMVSSFVEHAKQ